MGKQNDWTEYLKDALQNAELPVEDHSWAHRTLSARQSPPRIIVAGGFSTGFRKRRITGWTIGGLVAAAAISLCVLLWRPGATATDGLTAGLTKDLVGDYIESLATDGKESIVIDRRDGTDSIAADLTDGLAAGLTKDSTGGYENLSENLSKEQTGTEFNNPYLAFASSVQETSDGNYSSTEETIVAEECDEVETVPTIRDSEEKSAIPHGRSENEDIDDHRAGSDDITAWDNEIDSRQADQSRRKVSIGLSGSMGSAASPGSFGYGLFAIGSDSSISHIQSWYGLYSSSISELDLSDSTNSPDKSTHRQPVTFALTVGFPLNERLSLVSGIQFSRVQSTIRSARNNVAQSLNYIGIPLQAQYRLTGNGVFRTYAAAGVLGEKLLSGYIDGKRVNTGEAVQMSLNASLGARVQLWRNFSLRLEPGLRYYLTDSDFFTYRTYSPFVFSVTFGASIDL